MDEQNIPVAKPVETPPTQAQDGPPVQTASNKALAALILGILSIVCAGFLAGVPAIIIGRMELNNIKTGKAPKAGEGVAKVGFILGIVGTVLTCLIMLVSIALIILAASMGGMEQFQSTVNSV